MAAALRWNTQSRSGECALHRKREQRLARSLTLAFRMDVKVVHPARAERDEAVDRAGLREPHLAFSKHAIAEKSKILVRRVQLRQIGQARAAYGPKQPRHGFGVARFCSSDRAHSYGPANPKLLPSQMGP